MTADLRLQALGQRCWQLGVLLLVLLFWQRLAQMQHISGLQGASGMAAKLPQGKGALAAQILRRGKAAFDQQIAAGAAVGDLAQLQCATGAHQHALPVGQALAAAIGGQQARTHGGTGQHDTARAVKFQGRAA